MCFFLELIVRSRWSERMHLSFWVLYLWIILAKKILFRSKWPEHNMRVRLMRWISLDRFLPHLKLNLKNKNKSHMCPEVKYELNVWTKSHYRKGIRHCPCNPFLKCWYWQVKMAVRRPAVCQWGALLEIIPAPLLSSSRCIHCSPASLWLFSTEDPMLIAHCTSVQLNESCLVLNEGQSGSNVCK